MPAAPRYGLPTLGAVLVACTGAGPAPPPPERSLAVAQDPSEDAGGPAAVAMPSPGGVGAASLADAGPGPATIVYDDIAPAFGWLRMRVPLVARQAARADSPVLFGLNVGDDVQLMGRRGSWFLIEWKGGRGPSSAVPLGAHGWIAVDPDDSAKVERLVLTDAGVPANP